MKILNLGLDRTALDPQSKTFARQQVYQSLVAQYQTLVPPVGTTKIGQIFSLWRQARGCFRAQTFDLITVQDVYYLALLGYYLAQVNKTKLEIQVHGFEKYYGLRKLIAKFVLPRAAGIRTVSQRLKNKLVTELGVSVEKIVVIPLPLQITAGERTKQSSGGFIFLTVSRLVPIKNINLQLQALATSLKTKPNLQLWVVGAGPEQPKLEKTVELLGLRERVKFWGKQAALDQFYSQADAFLLTSDSEGWGVAVVEAAAWSLPIIMTDVGCAGELIHNNEEGLVIPVGDTTALTLAMLKLVEQSALAKALGQKAKQAALTLPNLAQTAETITHHWQQVIQL